MIGQWAGEGGKHTETANLLPGGEEAHIVPASSLPPGLPLVKPNQTVLQSKAGRGGGVHDKLL